jgi:hypothetical protein
MNKERETKINWFMLRTGSDREEAIKFLSITNWKIENAVQERRSFFLEWNNVRSQIGVKDE